MVDTPVDAARPVSPGVSAWWRAATIALLVLLSIAGAAGASMFAQFTAQIEHVQSKLKATAQVKYVAVLLDDKQAPAMLVTMNLQDNEMQIQRLNAVTEGREDSMQLWALSDGDPARSLGVLQSKGKTLRLPATERDFASATRLAISVEDKGGVTQAKGPRLPYLFTGSVVQKAL
ncbi:MAG: anti-sigma factor [Burkholderiales bacterium]|jgi:anti-sigma-K factor RskA|nr:anti-sigma factor [Burkholderiales bacterium]